MLWEYETIRIGSNTNLTEFNEKLNKMGREQWELVLSQDILLGGQGVRVLVFKREPFDETYMGLEPEILE